MLDVIVVGAGLSGLQAALDVKKAGYSVLVLEARNRVGGKTFSAPLASGRGCVELGAAWINDTNQHRMYAHSKRFGLELVKQLTDGDCLMHESDEKIHRFGFGKSPDFAASEVANLEKIRDIFASLSLDRNANWAELDEVDVETFVKRQGAEPKTIEMVNLWTRVMIGFEASEISARSFVDYCARGGGFKQLRSDYRDGAQYLRFRHGTQSVAKGIAKLLGPETIRLSNPVRHIQDLNDHVVVITAAGDVHKARKIITALPTPNYNSIIFSPPLTGDTAVIARATRLGYYTKFIVCYDKPWWREKGLCGMGLSHRGPICVARDTSVDAERQYSLTGFVNGALGREWSKLPAHERRAAALKQIALVYGDSEEAFKPIEVFEQEWAKEPWSQGAVCPMTGPGILNQYGHAYGKPIGNLHFVSTEFAREWKGYMEGAVCSGEDGAKEVIQALSRKPGGISARL
ncbi:flavine-containing amine oxidase [Saccharata proteae CBS 121410]|uniref:Amine oxidase n=1 Tax=Saccharata proteae CBS 121410 TaxID=1314787 RepID=A0A9P4LZV5_9PEZI|nr:flavine-containing amine oxidase [Saccharata proteae CBS 121410]